MIEKLQEAPPRPQEAQRQAAMTKKGFPGVNLFRFLPNRPDAKDVRTDGSYKFAKPWGTQWEK